MGDYKNITRNRLPRGDKSPNRGAVGAAADAAGRRQTPAQKHANAMKRGAQIRAEGAARGKAARSGKLPRGIDSSIGEVTRGRGRGGSQLKEVRRHRTGGAEPIKHKVTQVAKAANSMTRNLMEGQDAKYMHQQQKRQVHKDLVGKPAAKARVKEQEQIQVKKDRTKVHVERSTQKSAARTAHRNTQASAAARQATAGRLGGSQGIKLKAGGAIGAITRLPSAIGEYQRHKESGKKMTKGKALGIAYKLTGTPTPKSMRQDPT